MKTECSVDRTDAGFIWRWLTACSFSIIQFLKHLGWCSAESCLLWRRIKGNIFQTSLGGARSNLLFSCFDATRKNVSTILKTHYQASGRGHGEDLRYCENDRPIVDWEQVIRSVQSAVKRRNEIAAFLILSHLLLHPLFHAFWLLSILISSCSSRLSCWFQAATASTFSSSNKVSLKLPLLSLSPRGRQSRISLHFINLIRCTCSMLPPALGTDANIQSVASHKAVGVTLLVDYDAHLRLWTLIGGSLCQKMWFGIINNIILE